MTWFKTVLIITILNNVTANVTKTYNTSNVTRELIDESITYTTEPNIFRALWQKFPPILVPINSANELCRNHSQAVIHAFDRYDLWAVKMMDSSAKPPSGILHGNLNQYGDFDQCLSVTGARYGAGDDEMVNGKYCLATLDLKLPRGSERVRVIDDLMHSHYQFRSTFSDHGHRIPKFSNFNWAVCVPSSCDAVDVENEIRTTFRGMFPKTTQFDVHVESRMCYVKETRAVDDVWSLTAGEIIARFFLIGLILLTIAATFWEYFHGKFDNNNTNGQSVPARLVQCFALQSNVRRLLNVNGPNDIRSLDGIRCLSAIAILMSHKSMALLFNPYINRTDASQNLGMAWSIIGRVAIIYTDSFILISGLLNGNAYFKDLRGNGRMDVRAKVVSRLFRILPNLVAIILFCTYVLPKMGMGPLWSVVVDQHALLCKSHMWRNFFFVHNYFGFENMCLTHTHQVGIDMQLFLFCPLIVYMLWFRPRNGFVISGVVCAVSTALRFWAAIVYKISPIVYFGMKLTQIFDTANYSYILPTHRVTIYLMGVFVAYILTLKVQFQPKKSQLTAVWTLAMGVGLTTALSFYHMACRGYVYNVMDAAMFNAFAPITWGCFIAWVIYASNNNLAGWFGDFLSWRGFRLFTKIAYSFYLVQFPVFFFNIGRTRTASLYHWSEILNVLEYGFIVACSVALTVLVEIPFQNIHKILCKSGSVHVKKCK